MALGTTAFADSHGPLTVFGTWLGPDQEAVEAVLAGFTAATGHEVSYVGSDSFEQQIRIDAEAGSAPNIAVFPQPGLAADFASGGFFCERIKPESIGENVNALNAEMATEKAIVSANCL